MNKKILSLVLALVMVLGTFSTVFADDFDLVHKTNSAKNHTFFEFMEDTSAFEEVVDDFSNYLIEYNDKLYLVSEVQAELDGGAASIAAAVVGLTPYTPLPELEKWFIQLDTTAINDTIIANGDDNTTVIIKIVDEDGVVQPVNGIVIELSTSHGTLASAGQLQRVTLQNGMGTIKLNSEFSATPIVAQLTAKLYEAAEEYKELIGQKEVTFNVFFKPLGSETLETPIMLLAAESNQADRVTLYFDKEVDIEEFEANLEDSAEVFDIDVDQAGLSDYLNPVGFLPVPGNNKAVVAVLDVEDTPLRDNTWTWVEYWIASDYGVVYKEVNFLLTDARQPELVEVMVEADSLNQIRLKFSESISDIEGITIDGGSVDIVGWDIGTFDSADLTDGTFVPFKDYRSYVDVYINGWLEAGDHSVTVTKAADWAGVTDPKNVSTTQTLDFTVGENITLPTVEALVESPEQIRMTFAENVEFVNEEYGVNWWLEYDSDITAAESWVTIPSGLISTFTAVNQVVLEADVDWTVFFGTETTEENYYNFKWRLHAEPGVLINTKNGLTNIEINIGLNYVGSPLNSEDVTSPKNLAVDQTGDYNFDIVMNEPVKYRNTEDGIDTPSQEQGTDIPNVLVEFIGKNSAGTVVTIPGVVNGYGDEYSKDMVINVGEGVTSLQTLVDDNDYEEVWTLNVKNITDDVGNAAETVVWEFNVPKTVDVEEPDDAEFWINFAEFVDPDVDPLGKAEFAVRVHFTDLIKTSGGDQSAVLLSNYSINNQDLPAGTRIIVDLDSDATINGEDGYLAVIILLPEGFVPATSNTLEVAKTLKSQDEDPLKGFLEYPEFTRYQNVINGNVAP